MTQSSTVTVSLQEGVTAFNVRGTAITVADDAPDLCLTYFESRPIARAVVAARLRAIADLVEDADGCG
jgi:hypothetical protein